MSTLENLQRLPMSLFSELEQMVREATSPVQLAELHLNLAQACLTPDERGVLETMISNKEAATH